jgi:hypothetical protein
VGLGDLEPLEPAEEFVFLRHAPCVTFSGEQLVGPCLWGSVGELSKPRWLEAHLLVPGPWLAPNAGRELRIGSRFPSIGSLGLG